MKEKHFTTKMKTWIFLILALFAGQAAWGQITLLKFGLTVNNSATEGIAGNLSKTLTAVNSGGTAVLSFSSDGAATDKWLGNIANNYYWQTSFSTVGYYNILMFRT